MDFKNLVFNITFTIWLLLVSLISVFNILRIDSVTNAVQYVNQLRVKDTQNLVQAINTVAKKIPVVAPVVKK